MERDEAQENLRLIRLMMEEGRKSARDNGIHWVLWGCFGIVIFALGFFLPRIGLQDAFPFAVGVLYLGTTSLSFFFGRRIARGRRPGFAERAYSALWIGVSVCIALVTIALFATSRLPLPIALAIISAVFGSGVFASARLTGYSWLAIVAILWWLGACALFLMPFMAAAIAFSCLSLALCVAPGLILFLRRAR
jgi:hypothetical protein